MILVDPVIGDRAEITAMTSEVLPKEHMQQPESWVHARTSSPQSLVVRMHLRDAAGNYAAQSIDWVSLHLVSGTGDDLGALPSATARWRLCGDDTEAGVSGATPADDTGWQTFLLADDDGGYPRGSSSYIRLAAAWSREWLEVRYEEPGESGGVLDMTRLVVGLAQEWPNGYRRGGQRRWEEVGAVVTDDAVGGGHPRSGQPRRMANVILQLMLDTEARAVSKLQRNLGVSRDFAVHLDPGGDQEAEDLFVARCRRTGDLVGAVNAHEVPMDLMET